MEHSIAEVNFVIIYVLVFSQMAGGNNMLQICGIQFKDSKTGEILLADIKHLQTKTYLKKPLCKLV